MLESFVLPEFHSKSKGNTANRGKASRRVVDEPSHIGADFSTLEYAVDRKILETRVLELTYYVDSAGYVPQSLSASSLDEKDYGNGDASPEWGLDLIIHGGALRYGPWADRQRYVSFTVLIISFTSWSNQSPNPASIFPGYVSSSLSDFASKAWRSKAAPQFEYIC